MKVTTDSAFARTEHVSPTHTQSELRAMGLAARNAARATDRANKEVRKAVESEYVEREGVHVCM